MHITRRIDSLPPDATGSVLALGNFDGVHWGHQAVLKEALAIAQQTGAHMAAMTFEPHPRSFFNPALKPLRIYPVHTKLKLLRDNGVNVLFMPRFDAAFAQIAARDFIERILIGTLKVKHVVTGMNFTFGHKRQGDVALLESYNQFGTTPIAAVADEHTLPCSSTRIREALKGGDVALASELLGRMYAITGRVIHGQGRGRQIGVPTANIPVAAILLPAFGVYAVRVKLPDGRVTGGVANLGVRPTFGESAPALEVHCFGLDEELYGMRLEVTLLAQLRPERKFEGVEQLKTQIIQDIAQAKHLLEQGA